MLKWKQKSCVKKSGIKGIGDVLFYQLNNFNIKKIMNIHNIHNHIVDIILKSTSRDGLVLFGVIVSSFVNLPVDQRLRIVTVLPSQRDPPILVNTPHLCHLFSSFSELEEAFVYFCLLFFDYVRGPFRKPLS
jgi:hypothetical protein